MSQTSTQAQDGAKVARTRGPSRSAAPKTPSPPRRRRPALTALAVLLIVGGAALAGLFALRVDSREPVLVFRSDVAVGTELTDDLFAEADVASDGLALVGVDQLAEVRGLYLRQSVYAGQLLDTSMLTRTAPIDSSQAQVGVPLASDKTPPGIRIGDAVRLVRIADAQDGGSQPLCTGLVLAVEKGDGGGLTGGGADAVATVLVPQASADAVVGAAGNDELGMALLARGVSLDGATIARLGGS